MTPFSLSRFKTIVASCVSAVLTITSLGFPAHGQPTPMVISNEKKDYFNTLKDCEKEADDKKKQRCFELARESFGGNSEQKSCKEDLSKSDSASNKMISACQSAQIRGASGDPCLKTINKCREAAEKVYFDNDDQPCLKLEDNEDLKACPLLAVGDPESFKTDGDVELKRAEEAQEKLDELKSDLLKDNKDNQEKTAELDKEIKEKTRALNNLPENLQEALKKITEDFEETKRQIDQDKTKLLGSKREMTQRLRAADLELQNEIDNFDVACYEAAETMRQKQDERIANTDRLALQVKGSSNDVFTRVKELNAKANNELKSCLNGPKKMIRVKTLIQRRLTLQQNIREVEIDMQEQEDKLDAEVTRLSNQLPERQQTAYKNAMKVREQLQDELSQLSNQKLQLAQQTASDSMLKATKMETLTKKATTASSLSTLYKDCASQAKKEGIFKNTDGHKEVEKAISAFYEYRDSIGAAQRSCGCFETAQPDPTGSPCKNLEDKMKGVSTGKTTPPAKQTPGTTTTPAAAVSPAAAAGGAAN